MTVASISPTTGETLETFAETTPTALERVLDQALAAHQSWRRCSYGQRAQAMREAGRRLGKRKSQPDRTMALGMGKPLPHGEPGRGRGAWRADSSARRSRRWCARERRQT